MSDFGCNSITWERAETHEALNFRSRDTVSRWELAFDSAWGGWSLSQDGSYLEWYVSLVEAMAWVAQEEYRLQVQGQGACEEGSRDGALPWVILGEDGIEDPEEYDDEILGLSNAEIDYMKSYVRMKRFLDKAAACEDLGYVPFDLYEKVRAATEAYQQALSDRIGELEY